LSQHLDQQAAAAQGSAMRLPDMQNASDSFDLSQVPLPDNTPEPDNNNPHRPNPAAGTMANRVQLNNQQLLWLQAMYGPLASNLAREAMRAGKEQVPEFLEHVAKEEYEQNDQEKRQNAYGPHSPYFNRVQTPLPYPTSFAPSQNVLPSAPRQLSVYG